MKILDVGAGFFKYPGSISIDGNKNSKPDILHDLNSFPWPIADNIFDMVYSSHCIEHLDEPAKTLEEIWRVSRNNALVLIKIPHFSSRVAWTDIGHKRAFSSTMFRHYTKEFARISDTKVKFEIEKIRFNWQQRIDMEFVPKKLMPFVPFISLFNEVISGLANMNIEFCERVWCYYVGGIGEMEFYARVIK
jgi:SAM-dependent methyltransferase